MKSLLHCALFGVSFGNVIELIGLIIVFILILFATYYTSRWIGKNGANLQQIGNLKVVETYRLSQTKYLQIIRVGLDKYFLIAVTKDNVSFISEISEDDIDLSCYEKKGNVNLDFSDILKKLTKKNK